MRYRLRTLLILMAIGPPVLGLTVPWVIARLREWALVNVIPTTITPQSWDDVGGPGTLKDFDGGCTIVVSTDSEPEPESDP